MQRYCLYHAGCADGFCAAYLYWKIFEDTTFIPVQHGEPFPAIPKSRAHKSIMIVDFSYNKETLEQVRARKDVKSLLVLDHHKSAESLASLPYVTFDTTKSGAELMLDHLWSAARGTYPEHLTEGLAQATELVGYVADRDLWKWNLPHSREISAWLRSYPFDFLEWDSLARTLQSSWAWEVVAKEGAAILREQSRMTDAKAKQAFVVKFPIGRYLTMQAGVCNATDLISETCEKILEKMPDVLFACSWFELENGSKVYSLRSRKNSTIDVSDIAKLYGGGGHPNAAGFTLPAGQPHPWGLR